MLFGTVVWSDPQLSGRGPGLVQARKIIHLGVRQWADSGSENSRDQNVMWKLRVCGAAVRGIGRPPTGRQMFQTWRQSAQFEMFNAGRTCPFWALTFFLIPQSWVSGGPETNFRQQLNTARPGYGFNTTVRRSVGHGGLFLRRWTETKHRKNGGWKRRVWGSYTCNSTLDLSPPFHPGWRLDRSLRA